MKKSTWFFIGLKNSSSKASGLCLSPKTHSVGCCKNSCKLIRKQQPTKWALAHKRKRTSSDYTEPAGNNLDASSERVCKKTHSRNTQIRNEKGTKSKGTLLKTINAECTGLAEIISFLAASMSCVLDLWQRVLITQGCFCYCREVLARSQGFFCSSYHPTSEQAGGAHGVSQLTPTHPRNIPHHMMSFPDNHYVWWSPYVLENMAEHLHDHWKCWTNSLCTQLLLFLLKCLYFNSQVC